MYPVFFLARPAVFWAIFCCWCLGCFGKPIDFADYGLAGKFYDGRFTVYGADYAIAEEVGAQAQGIYQRVIDDTGYAGAHTRKYQILVWADEKGFKDFLAAIGANVPAQSTAVALHGFFDVPTIAGYRDADFIGRGLPHEFTHLIMADILAVKPQDIPLWLSEGLATYEAGRPLAQVNDFLRFAVSRGENISLAELLLLQEYPASRERLDLFYLQSQSFVGFLLEKKSRKDIFFLLIQRLAKNRESLETAYRHVYGESASIEGLEREWFEYLGIPEE